SSCASSDSSPCQARAVCWRTDMSGATLASLQDALTEIYDLPVMPDVRDFLMTDRAGLGSVNHPRAGDEQLIVAEDGDTLSMALYIDAAVLERLEQCDPFAGLTQANLADYLTVAEGVSHFVYVAWNTGYDKPVTLLELELQAEVDKYVLCAWLLREQGRGRFPRELHRVLFERAHVDPVSAAGRVDLYHLASNYAARFCRRVAALLERKRHGVTRDLMAELRRFYRWGNIRKMRHIERYA
ncbi:MAG TPA: hypothetical protein VFS58_17495, partial [Steroidobacteraceae bacterium]|nr:hypothetical protein [Steroidobacteraceae bacterium]